MRIGYLVPEFPSQTHAFFWREIEELERLGVEVDLVSTRRPAKTAPHRWVDAAMARTTFLHPMPARQTPAMLLQALKAGPMAWGRCFVAAASTVRDSLSAAARMAGMGVLGARLAALAQQRHWDHLHVHSCADAANIALFAYLIDRLPYSLTLHGDLSGYGSNQHQKWRHASFAVVICAALIEQVREVLREDVPARLIKAPMGVELAAFTRHTPYQPFEGAGPFRVFCCGRLHPGKGHADLIDAVALLRDRGFDARLTIAGEDAGGSGYRVQLEQVIERRGLAAHVRLAGALSEQAVRDHLESSHVFALASHIEGLGVATMEAMAMGLPVVVTRSGGVPELVEDGREGLLVEPRVPEQMTDALLKLAQSPGLCAAMSEAGRRKVETAYHSGLSARAIVDGIAGTRQMSRGAAPAAATANQLAR